MSDEIRILNATLALMVIWGLWTGAYHRLMVDHLRSRLFEVRDNVFDLALVGTLSFSDRAYGLLRTRANSTIRFAHRLTWLTLLVMGVSRRCRHCASPEMERWEAAWRSALSELPSERAAIYAGARATLQRRELAHLLVLALPGFVLLLPVLLVLLVVVVFLREQRRAIAIVQRRLSRAVSQAVLEDEVSSHHTGTRLTATC